MAHFYLNLHNAHVDVSDEEGVDLPDLEAARQRAIAGIRDFIGHEAFAGTIDLRGQVDVSDESGTTLASVRFAEAFTIHDDDRAG